MATDKRICSVDGCGKEVHRRGMCNAHYRRLLKHGDTSTNLNVPDWKGHPCSVSGCESPAKTRGLCGTHYERERTASAQESRDLRCCVSGCGNAAGKPGTAHGMCSAHYNRWRRHGDALAGNTARHARPDWIEVHKDHLGDECLIWPFSRGKRGYGTTSFDGVPTNASRAMCIAAHGQPPTPSYQAAHSCGKGSSGCVNPRHLYWATTAENQADKAKHGSLIFGERHKNAKLTDAEARAIKAATGTQQEIADRFRIGRNQVQKIKAGKAWRWLDGDDEARGPSSLGC